MVLIHVELPTILPTVCFCTVIANLNKEKYDKWHIYY